MPHKREKGLAAVSDVTWELIQKQIRKTSSCSVCRERVFLDFWTLRLHHRDGKFFLKKDQRYYLFVTGNAIFFFKVFIWGKQQLSNLMHLHSITISQRKLCTLMTQKLMFISLHSSYSYSETHQQSKERQMLNSVLFRSSHNHSCTDFNRC